MALFNRARPIEEVVRDERTPPRIQALLSEIDPIKKFGESQGLKPTRNYTEYVKLDRPAAVWVVSACEPLAFRSKVWSFPIVGEFPYLGWFDLGAANGFAAGMRHEGLDVDVRPAGAYSTLGWFKDAVLSSMIPEGENAVGDVTNVVLHESVHATVYVKGQAYFNESLASFVADRLTVDYLARTRGAESAVKKAFLENEARVEKIHQRLHAAYGELSRLYASARPDEEKRTEKARILDGLRAELKFRREINNATLIQYKTYNSSTPAFEKLLSACGRDWGRFLQAAGRLEKGDFAQSQQEELGSVLDKLVGRGC